MVIGFCVLLTALRPPIARAGYPVQPDGVSVSGQPSFLVYLDDGETTPTVEVAASPDMSVFKGSCTPFTPFGETHKFSCRLSSRLDPGTYYWTFSYWKRDDCKAYEYLGTYCYLQEHTSAPLRFTIAKPEPPAGAALVSPPDGGRVEPTPTLTVRAPVGSTLRIYVATSGERLSDGTPVSPIDSCAGTASGGTTYSCTVGASLLVPGSTYYWWALITTEGSSWIYGPRTFTVRLPTSGPSGVGRTHRTDSTLSRTAFDAAFLHKAMRFRGHSVIHSRLSRAAYQLSKYLGKPKLVNVVCWSSKDWPSVSGDTGDGYYQEFGFYSRLMPHWIHLSPGVCRAIETLLHHRPRIPNTVTSNAIETLAHEEMHALGVDSTNYPATAEAVAECFGMQLSILAATQLGVPYAYANRLAQLNLANYERRPPQYRNVSKCREDGAWDILKGRPSPPWHTFK